VDVPAAAPGDRGSAVGAPLLDAASEAAAEADDGGLSIAGRGFGRGLAAEDEEEGGATVVEGLAASGAEAAGAGEGAPTTTGAAGAVVGGEEAPCAAPTSRS
jgi:hypothetical protein